MARKARTHSKTRRPKANRAIPEPAKKRYWHPVPLKGSVMVTSIVGFLLSAHLIEDADFRVAFMLVFTAMFVASLISMTKAPVIEQ